MHMHAKWSPSKSELERSNPNIDCDLGEKRTDGRHDSLGGGEFYLKMETVSLVAFLERILQD